MTTPTTERLAGTPQSGSRRLVTELPGPRSRELAARKAETAADVERVVASIAGRELKRRGTE